MVRNHAVDQEMLWDELLLYKMKNCQDLAA